MAATNELKIGVLVLLALVILGGGIMFMRDWRANADLNKWKVGFIQVGGLSNGDPVLVQGVRQGQVDKIQLQQGIVVATLKVRKEILLTRNSRVSIAALGLMGERVVDIDLGRPDRPWPQDSLFPGEFQSGTPEVMSRLGPIMQNVDTVLISVRQVAEDLHSSGALGRVIGNADRTVADLSRLMAENRVALHRGVADLSASAAALRRFTDTKTGKLEATADQFAEASARLKKITEDFEDAAGKLNAVATRLEQGQGTLGKLSKDPAVFDELHKAAADLDALVKDMKANPKKYLKVSVF